MKKSLKVRPNVKLQILAIINNGSNEITENKKRL
jgi:hypothetical protein